MTNLWIGVGRLTRDPELRYAESGKAVAPMRVAVPRAGDDGADFFDVVAFGTLGEACAEHLAKGRRILVEGSLRHNTWNDTEGAQRSKVEIIANRVQFLDSPRREVTTADPAA